MTFATVSVDPLDTGSSAPPVVERSLERALGARIRATRRQHDLSVADLASAAGISAGMLSKIENGGISASLTTLQAISTALQVSLSSLFAAFEERQDCSHVAAGQALVLERRGTKVGHVYHLLGHVLRGDVVVEPYLIILRENAAPYTNFRHAGVEFIYMLQGDLPYRHGAEVYHLQEGDSLLFDSSAAHGPAASVGRETRFLSIIVYARPES